jgi:hypothetical protein
VKDLAARGGGFASIEVVPTLVQDRPQLFAMIGNIKLYKEVPAEYLKTLLFMSKLLTIRDTANYYLYRKPVKTNRSFGTLG